MIQEHSATRLHWDLRLEHDGVAASWAVPNGIPDVPGENRKAVHTEDHPLEYLHFEGEIPKGSYGAGTMFVWDSGTYDCEVWEDKKLTVVFHGERVTGRYHLFQAGREEKDWMIRRVDPPADPDREPLPEHVVPMTVAPGELPAGDDWGFEIAWSGQRVIAFLEPGRIRIENPGLDDVTALFPEVRRLKPGTDSAIRTRARGNPVVFVVYDLLHLDGRSTMGLSYRERRELLDGLGLDGDAWRVPAYHRGDGAQLLEAAAAQGLDGIVAKPLGSPYEPGKPGWTDCRTAKSG